MTLLEKFLDPDIGEDFNWPYVIAGGCLRDSFFGKEVVDVDLFVALPKTRLEEIKKAGEFYVSYYDGGGESPRSIWDRFPGDAGSTAFKIDSGDGYDELGDFISGKNPEHPGLNIILREYKDTWSATGAECAAFATELIETFPCSISKVAWFPPTDTWWFSEDFKKTLETKVVEFTGGTTDKYYKKIYPKYDDLFPHAIWIL